MRDANSFVASSREAIQRSAPHIYVSAVPFAARDSLVYSIFYRQCTGLISVETLGIGRHGGRLAMSLAGHTKTVKAIAYLPDGRLASGSYDGTVRIWNMRTGGESMPHFASGDGDVRSVAVAQTGKSLASGTETGIVCLWSLEAPREPPRRLRGHDGWVYSVAFSPDGQLIASVGGNGLCLWDVETGQQVSVTSATKDIRAIVFSPDGNIMASLSNDKEVWLWRLSDIPTVVHVLGHKTMVSSMCFSPDSTKLATYTRKTKPTIQLWEMATRTTIFTFGGVSESVRSIQFSPDGGSLMSVSDDRGVELWKLDRDVKDETSVLLGGQWVSIESATHSPDGLYIALTYSYSEVLHSEIQIWDVGSSPEATEPLPAHDGAVRSV